MPRAATSLTSLTAIKGDGAKHSIGAGADGSCGKVTVGGKEGAVSASPFIFPVVVTGVTLSQTEAELKPGETLTLTATVAPDYVWDKSVTWSSSDEAVATVTDGVVTAKGEGTATITATSVDGGKTATCTVSVTPVVVTGVTLSQTEASLFVGGTLALTATVAPSNATYKGVTWSSSDEAVATVTDGVVTGKAVGMVIITVTTADGGMTATCTVTVSNTQDLALLTNHFTAPDGITLTGTLGANVKISIADGATVTLYGVTINGVDNAAYKWAGITCNGNATIILKGSNSVRGFYRHYPGIHIAQGKTLTIRGDGSLSATCNSSGAGIGSGYKINCGNIVIEGGTINASGNTGGTGIGSGRSSSCGSITIKGGTVNATAGTFAAGIGAGDGGSCGDITITSSVTSVTATKGLAAQHSIGAGYKGSCGTVTIGDKTGAIDQSPYTYKP